jgi:benzoate transport
MTMSVGTGDPRQTVASGNMGLLQVIVVAITIGLNALDGFDVQSMTFASAGIRQQWQLPPDGLFWVLSMELWGMALGSLLLGGMADKLGRRPTTLYCLLLMAAGMYLASTAQGPVQLSVWRLLTGLGIGGLLAAINAIAAEFANTRRKALCISLMAIGYPIGAVVGGKIVANLLVGHDWRSVFYFGTAITALFLPVVLFLMPESVHWLVRKQPTKALERVNRALQRMGHPTTEALPVIAPEQRKRSIADIFAPALRVTTLLLAAIYFFHVVTFYFLIKWIMIFIVDMGFTQPDGANVIVWANIGGATGGAVLGLLTLRLPVKPLTIVLMVLSMVTVATFGHAPKDLQKLALFAALAGFCANGAIVGMYSIFAHAYPTHVRAFGTGFAIGIGRGGSALAPVITGYLIKAGYSAPVLATIMGSSALVAAILLSFLKLQPGEKHEEPSGTPSLSGAST